MAEGVGFEPTGPRKEPSDFQDRRLKPLGHPSGGPHGVGSFEYSTNGLYCQ